MNGRDDVYFYFTAKRANVDHRTTAPLIAVKAFEVGFRECHVALKADYTKQLDRLNAGLDKDTLDSALYASVFGWEIPMARKAKDYIALCNAQYDAEQALAAKRAVQS